MRRKEIFESENVSRIAGINLAILMGYLILLAFTPDALIDWGATLIIFQFTVNLFISIVFFTKKEKNAKAFLLSAFLVLLIGFPACFTVGLLQFG